MEYQDYNDYELVNYIAEGNEDASEILIHKYTPLVNHIASQMFNLCTNTGLEYVDLKQEGMIGLMNAIDTFDDQKDAVFYTYAKTCIKRNILTTITTAKRLKHRILNESISFDSDDFNNYLLKDVVNIPENIIVDSDYTEKLLTQVHNKLTVKETQVFNLLIAGFNYKEIAELLEQDTKSIDNTIQRIKRKLRNILNDK